LSFQYPETQGGRTAYKLVKVTLFFQHHKLQMLLFPNGQGHVDNLVLVDRMPYSFFFN
jgi:hypothetical protein